MALQRTGMQRLIFLAPIGFALFLLSFCLSSHFEPYRTFLFIIGMICFGIGSIPINRAINQWYVQMFRMFTEKPSKVGTSLGRNPTISEQNNPVLSRLEDGGYDPGN